MTDWDESKHPRDPEGSKTGGQFTSSSGFSADERTWAKLRERTKGMKQVQVFLDGENDEDEDGWPDNIPHKYGERFYNSNNQASELFGSAMEEEEFGATVLVDKSKTARAFYAGAPGLGGLYATKDLDVPEIGDNPFYLAYLGAVDDSAGWGPIAFAEAARDACWEYECTSMLWQSLDSASSFYKALGAHAIKGSDGWFYLTAEDIDALLGAFDSKISKG